jgi:transposase
MGEAYSEDLRQRILRAVDKGLAVRQVSGLYEVSTSFIYKALIRRRTTGEAGARGGRNPIRIIHLSKTLYEFLHIQISQEHRICELEWRAVRLSHFLLALLVPQFC